VRSQNKVAHHEWIAVDPAPLGVTLRLGSFTANWSGGFFGEVKFSRAKIHGTSRDAHHRVRGILDRESGRFEPGQDDAERSIVLRKHLDESIDRLHATLPSVSASRLKAPGWNPPSPSRVRSSRSKLPFSESSSMALN
jgi:hypothetical protein